MVTSSAPGKVYLFGEHAVVYGEPAVPCAIQRRARVTVETRQEGLRVHAGDLSLDGFTVEYDGDAAGTPDVDVPDALVEAGVGYVNEAVEQAKEAAGVDQAGFDITVESEIPLGAGIGSSAAVVVAAIDAATRELGVELSPAEIAERAYRVEHTVQDGQASRADTFCSAMGGAVRVEGEDCRTIAAPELPFVIGYDGGAGDTGALVSGVRSLRDTYDFAADTVGAIGDIVRRGEDALADSDIEELGRLMNFTHGLLEALGVSSRSLDAMVWAARDAGALGAKLTGAGGGGCIVALDRTAETKTALEYTPGCQDAFRRRDGERPAGDGRPGAPRCGGWRDRDCTRRGARDPAGSGSRRGEFRPPPRRRTRRDDDGRDPVGAGDP
jgi:mevalonate kinase